MEIISTKNAPAAIGAYSQGVATGAFVFASGQIPVNPATGEVVQGGIKEQTEQVCKNVAELLKAAGTDISKVVKTTCFITDMGAFSDFNEVYARYFTGKPARSCVEVSKLPKGVCVEIEAIAEK